MALIDDLRAAALAESWALRRELPSAPVPDRRPAAPAFLFTVTCPRCGHPLETAQVARTSGLRASVILRCAGRGCPEQQVLVQLLPVPFHRLSTESPGLSSCYPQGRKGTLAR